MDKQMLIEKIKAMAAAPSCCPELTAAVQNYFAALGSDNEKSAAQNLIKELENDITTVDDLVIFAHSDRAKEIFGDNQKNFAAHADHSKLAAQNSATAARALPLSKFLTTNLFCSPKLHLFAFFISRIKISTQKIRAVISTTQRSRAITTFSQYVNCI